MFLFLGQLWQLFEVSQILEFLRYSKCMGTLPYFSAIKFYTMRNNSCKFHFASLDTTSFQRAISFVQQIFSSKSCPPTNSNRRDEISENDRVSSPESVPIYLSRETVNLEKGKAKLTETYQMDK